MGILMEVMGFPHQRKSTSVAVISHVVEALQQLRIIHFHKMWFVVSLSVDIVDLLAVI